MYECIEREGEKVSMYESVRVREKKKIDKERGGEGVSL